MLQDVQKTIKRQLTLH